MATELTTWKQMDHQTDPETGERLEHEPMVEKEHFELKADGKDVGALDEMMEGVGDVHAQQAFNRERKHGVAVCSDPNGNPVRVLQTEVSDLEANGYNRAALKSTFRVNVPWEGSMRRLGIRKQKIGNGWVETWYRDGRRTLELIAPEPSAS